MHIFNVFWICRNELLLFCWKSSQFLCSPLAVPCTVLMADKLPVVRTVQGDCERVLASNDTRSEAVARGAIQCVCSVMAAQRSDISPWVNNIYQQIISLALWFCTGLQPGSIGSIVIQFKINTTGLHSTDYSVDVYSLIRWHFFNSFFCYIKAEITGIDYCCKHIPNRHH